jgi:hypothetical protein
MKKILSILLAVTMVFSLMVGFRAPTAKAVAPTVVLLTKPNSLDTGVPTYTMGELIQGKTNDPDVTSGSTIYLLDSAGNTVDKYTVGQADSDGYYYFVLRTNSTSLKEGFYYISDDTSLDTGANGDKQIYIKYAIGSVTPSTAPEVGSTNVLVSGRLYHGDTSSTPAQDVYTKVYLSWWNGSAWQTVASGTTSDGWFSFYANFNGAGKYALFVEDTNPAYAPDYSTDLNQNQVYTKCAQYATWNVSAGAITATLVFDPTLLYAGTGAPTPQYAYVRLTDANGLGVTGLTASNFSSTGLGSIAGVTELADGFYALQLTPPSTTSGGLMNVKVTTADSVANFSLYFQPFNQKGANPQAKLITNSSFTGFKIGSYVAFEVDYNYGSNCFVGRDPSNMPLQYTEISGPANMTSNTTTIWKDNNPVYNYRYFNDASANAVMYYYAQITNGGQFDIVANAVVWDTNDPLEATPTVVKQEFKVNPAVPGDVVTVTTDPSSLTVGDTATITVNVKTSSGIERNNALVYLYGNPGTFGNYDSSTGTYKAPTGAQYIVASDGSNVSLDASFYNVNIYGGNYVFSGLKINKPGYISVLVEYRTTSLTWVVTANLIGQIYVNYKTVTLTADVTQLVAGQSYSTGITVKGGVPGLSFGTTRYIGSDTTPLSVGFTQIDNQDGTYTFIISSVPDITKVRFRAYDPSISDPNVPDSQKNYTQYQIYFTVVKPTLTIGAAQPSVTLTLDKTHQDGLITDSFTEQVMFKLVDPITGQVMVPTDAALIHQFDKWDKTGQGNLQVSDGSSSVGSLGEVNTLYGTWTYGNPNANDDPFVGLQVKMANGVTITYKPLKVADPSIKFDVQGRDPMVLYKGVENTITATAFDAHGDPLKNALVGIAGNVQSQWQKGPWDAMVEAGGRTGSDGKVVFTYTPNYIGNYKLFLGVEHSDQSVTVLKTSYVQSVEAPKDTTAPTLTITAPADKSTVNTETVKVTGKATDDVGVTLVAVNDVPVTLLPDGSFATTVTLTEGDNTIVVKAFDAAKNVATQTLTVTYKKPTPPAPTGTKIVLKIGSDVMTVNGKVVQLEAAPEIKDGRTFLPLRAIAEAFGAQVTWVPDTQGITVVLGNNQIGLQVGNNTAVVNGNVLSIVPPYIKNGRTMVPLRVIADGFGAQVDWDPVNYIITITMP